MNHSTTAPLTFDHRSSSTLRGGPASHFRRIERPDRSVRVVRSSPNYVVRRLGVVVAAVAAVLVLASALDAVLVSFGGDPAFADDVPPAAETAAAAHVAQPGDSLWSIANQYRGEVERDRYVRALIALNGSTTIIVGQAIALP
ncbi:LysM peptidoglycan-binding domain-containing protein [Ilumatobacter nonamiensis]|uniref:LysM peptidoglycan-binding domain-containing protein n=1 Tax=Ilumatobacter nonamiensis TaxID=467093 RepID=UPI0003459F87|nr:LysM peptidoglycan-binding domain-containing protein [Ilumatobacter nonamiensis]